jgi:hypothetical protein
MPNNPLAQMPLHGAMEAHEWPCFYQPAPSIAYKVSDAQMTSFPSFSTTPPTWFKISLKQASNDCFTN